MEAELLINGQMVKGDVQSHQEQIVVYSAQSDTEPGLSQEDIAEIEEVINGPITWTFTVATALPVGQEINLTVHIQGQSYEMKGYVTESTTRSHGDSSTIEVPNPPRIG